MGSVRDVILDVIFDVFLDVMWIYFGCHFGDPDRDPAGAARVTSGRVVEVTSSETWSFAQARWPVWGIVPKHRRWDPKTMEKRVSEKVHAGNDPSAPLKDFTGKQMADLQGLRDTPLVPQGHGGGLFAYSI